MKRNLGGEHMKVKCLNCGHEFETTEIKEDDLGLHCICEECGASFDVDVDSEGDQLCTMMN